MPILLYLKQTKPNIMKVNFVLLLMLMSVVGCKKDKQSTEGMWTLKNYNVTYYNQAGDKVYESKPDELLQFSKIEINNDSIAVFQEVKSTASQSPIKTDPANLISLIAKKSLNTVSLNFITANEVNAKEWIIERSGPAIDFQPIGTLPAANTLGTHNYYFTDNSPLFGLNFYRVKQVDNDGKYEYSIIVVVSMDFHLTKENGDINLPVDLINHTFKQVAITFPGRRMIWSSEAENPQYTENGVTKTAASATLVMAFDK